MAEAAGHPDGAGSRLALPEFTRSLRAFASVGALGTRAHDLVFNPLLTARRAAMRVQAPESRAAAFDAERLRRSFTDAIATLAGERCAGHEPTRRALEARLEEAAVPVFHAIAALDRRAKALRAGNAADAWPGWCDAVQGVFNAADAFVLRVDDVAPPGARGPLRLTIPALMLAAALAALATAAPAAQAQHRTYRVDGARTDSLLAAGFDVVGLDRGAPLVVAAPDERARLAARGFSATEVPTPATLRANAVTTPVVYRSFDDPGRGIRRWVDSVVAANPRVSVDTIGQSFEGRPIFALKVGPKGDSPQRPNVLFLATYHAREWAATETALRLVKYLAAPPGDAHRDSLVQGRDIWIVPVANPDGYQFTFASDRLWRKTRSPQAGGNVGVDMNRNHSVNWGFDNQGSSNFPESDIFRGPSPASETEVRAIEAFLAAHPPVVSVSYHTYGGLILYPPGATYGPLPADLPVYRAIAGTHLHSASPDRLPGSPRSAYAPGPAWSLYTTNGEYTDFASSRFGTIAFTQELTSGTGPAGFYGFEFPDDDALLEQLFQDALPFALNVLDAASAPAAFVSAATGIRTGRLEVESAAPVLRATVPAGDAPGSSYAAIGAPTFRIDSTSGGRYTRRLVSSEVGRPAAFAVKSGGITAPFRVLAISGAESADEEWTGAGFKPDTQYVRAGRYSWRATQGTLTSPAIRVPADIDTVSLRFWTIHFGSGFSAALTGTVAVTADEGVTWTPVAYARGFAPEWYPDGADVGGVSGKTIRFRFFTTQMQWHLDEIAVIGHARVSDGTVAGGPQVRPSENPVRSAEVRLSWPWPGTAGDLIAYDFSGREVWRAHVPDGATQTWRIAADGVGNGAYVVVARAGSQVSRLKLFVARRSP